MTMLIDSKEKTIVVMEKVTAFDLILKLKETFTDDQLANYRVMPAFGGATITEISDDDDGDLQEYNYDSISTTIPKTAFDDMRIIYVPEINTLYISSATMGIFELHRVTRAIAEVDDPDIIIEFGIYPDTFEPLDGELSPEDANKIIGYVTDEEFDFIVTKADGDGNKDNKLKVAKIKKDIGDE